MAKPDYKNWAPLGLKVWVIMYSHRHGADVTVYGNEERAYKSAVEIIMEWIGDIEEKDEDAAEEIKRLAASGDDRKVLERWREWQHDGNDPETIDIESLDVQ